MKIKFNMNIKKYIPNIITLLNLFCGCIALVFVADCKFEYAFLFVSLGIFLDFFDGFFARLFKVSSPLGLQLDSLADMVTSGVVPGYVMFQMFKRLEYDLELISIFSFFGFIITLGACYRLANFNIDTRQTDSFIGLPTPANALFILSLPLITGSFHGYNFSSIIYSEWILMAITLISAYIMNAEIALFSLKIKSYNLKDNLLQVVFLLISLAIIAVFQYLGVAIVILFYVLLSVLINIFKKK